jgi:hypothetical protein
MKRTCISDQLRRALEAIDAAVEAAHICPRLVLFDALRERTTCEVERQAITALHRALDDNRMHSCHPESMRYTADNLENAAGVLAELLRDGADYADAGHRRAAE